MALDPRRATATVTFLLVSIASVYFLQSVFDRSDHKKGLAIARAWSAGGATVEGVLAHRNPGASIAWRTAIANGCYGVVRATALVVPPSGPAVEYGFDVDIPRVRLVAADDRAAAVLAEVMAPAGTAATSAPVSAPVATPDAAP